MPGVSECATISTAAILPALTVTSTVMGPPKPVPVPVYVPSAQAGSAPISAPTKAFSTAFIMASLVNVAPETISTAGLFAATIRPGILLSAPSEIPGVSECEVTSTSAILPPLTVTSTASFPPKESASPVYVPSAQPAAASVTGKKAFMNPSSERRTPVATAREEMVAPETPSISVPRAKALLASRPTNCSKKLG